jgi:membrane peptidoglycan carboxypeptidase
VRKYVRAHPNVLVALIVVVSLAFWTLSGSATWLSMDVMRDLPTGQQIAGIGNMAQATTLYDIADKPVFAVFKEQRIEVPLANVSPHLIKAIVSIEDQRFFDHRGLDLVRVGAAALANMRQGRAAQGGSTITQQLARQSFLTLDKTFRRKIRELIVAAAIERAYTKEQILELYLNKVYFGDGFHGVEAASLGFFGRHASELTVSQAALLAGLVQSPSTYAPTVNLARARSRRDVVLAAMFGTDAIDRPTYDAARRDPIRLRNALRGEEDFGLYFKEQVRRELVDRFGWDRVYQGGLKVYTTIDPAVQRAAEVLAE